MYFWAFMLKFSIPYRIIEASNLSASDPGNPWRFHRLCINTVRDHVINTAGETSPVW